MSDETPTSKRQQLYDEISEHFDDYPDIRKELAGKYEWRVSDVDKVYDDVARERAKPRAEEEAELAARISGDIRKLQAHYCDYSGKFHVFFEDAWHEHGRQSFGVFLSARYWYQNTKGKFDDIAETDRFLDRVQMGHRIDATAEWSGWPKGIFTAPDGNRVLIRKGFEEIPGHPGEFRDTRDFPVTWAMLLRLFDGDMLRVRLFLGWLKHLRKMLRHRNGNSLILLIYGPPNSGKSLLLNVGLVLWLAKRYATYTEQSEKSAFNDNETSCELLVIDDPPRMRSGEEKQGLSLVLKRMTATNVQRIEQKYEKAHTAILFRGIAVATNADVTSLGALFALGGSLADKILTLQVKPEPWEDGFKDVTDPIEQRRQRQETLAAEAPAFLGWLEEVFELPAKLTCSRFGVRARLDPGLAEDAAQTAPYTHMGENLQEYLSVRPEVSPLPGSKFIACKEKDGRFRFKITQLHREIRMYAESDRHESDAWVQIARSIIEDCPSPTAFARGIRSLIEHHQYGVTPDPSKRGPRCHFINSASPE